MTLSQNNYINISILLNISPYCDKIYVDKTKNLGETETMTASMRLR